MDNEYISHLVDHLCKRGVAFESGLSSSEVNALESKFHFQFPPDLKAFLQYALPVSKGFPDWRHGTEADLRNKMDWPLQGILFDIEHNGFWINDWGPKPTKLTDALAIARREVSQAPVLIPVFSHRYLPSEPVLADNPILSVYQTDIIIYGANLTSYFTHEFEMEGPLREALPTRSIRFWSDLVT